MASEQIRPDELTALFARIHGLVPDRDTVDGAVRALTRSVREAVPEAAGAGVSVLDDRGGKISAGATDRIVELADALQYELGEGPCLTAWESAATVRIDDTLTGDRWPRWCPAAHALGVRSVLSMPLLDGQGAAIGAIKVYSTAEAAFDGHAERRLGLSAITAGVLLGHISTLEAPRRLSDGLRDALRSRDAVAMARGMLMERGGITAAGALSVLLSAAADQQRPVRSVAEGMVAGNGRDG